MNRLRVALALFAATLVLAFACGIAAAQETPSEQQRRTTVEAVRLGFQNVYKVGYWTPVEVGLGGGDTPYTGFLELTLPDGDGVQSSVITPPNRPVQTTPGRTTTVSAFVKPGRADGELRVRFVAEGRPRAERRISVAFQPNNLQIGYGNAAIDELILTLGPQLGLGGVLAGVDPDTQRTTHVVPLGDISELPIRWYGYDAVNTLVLSTSDVQLYRGLTAGTARAQALLEWVERGGDLVMFVGAEAPEILAGDSPLSELAPGRFDRLVDLRQTRSIEAYADTREQIDLAGASLTAPRLSDVRGTIAAFEGNRPEDLPLVVRAPFGFGNVTFVALDLNTTPLDRWEGRDAFLRTVIRPGEPVVEEDESQANLTYLDPGYLDLTGQLRAALDQFTGVQVVPFYIVATLVLGYILLIGPVDYMLVKHGLKRMELTWLTFPVIVIVVSGGAYALANWTKGDRLRLNQVELIDADVERGLVRGTVWSHIFSPRADSYNLGLAPVLPGGGSPTDPQKLVAWLGLPGDALGGMGMQATGTPFFDRPYYFGPEFDQLLGVPIQVWSTKSITGRWTSRDSVPLSADLSEIADQMLAGQIENGLGMDLGQCQLLYDRWVYTIANIPQGARIELRSLAEPQLIKTWLGANESAVAGQDVTSILRRMMFYDAAGGSLASESLNLYQQFCDLSGQLTAGRAILVTHQPHTDGSQLLRDGEPLTSPDDRRWLVYRFVLPVARDGETTSP
ncbi:MAG: hypothetical protein WDZ59_02710 [Pirellulales bacterium]